MGTLHRTQILLETKQHQTLSEIAHNEGRSISEIVREIIHKYLEEQEQDAKLQRELAALEALNEMRKKIQAQHGIIDRDLVAEIRAEREAELERTWDSRL